MLKGGTQSVEVVLMRELEVSAIPMEGCTKGFNSLKMGGGGLKKLYPVLRGGGWWWLQKVLDPRFSRFIAPPPPPPPPPLPVINGQSRTATLDLSPGYKYCDKK